MGADEDYYALLGVPPGAGLAELKRAYHARALTCHPDVAPTPDPALFLRLTEAYRVLSDADERAAYDRSRQASRTTAEAVLRRTASSWPGGARGRRPLERLSGSLDDLVARALARRHPDGAIELLLTAAEARDGGMAAFDTRVRVSCPTCGGLARPRTMWCMRCQFEGTVDDEITVAVIIPALTPDGAMFTIPVDPTGLCPPLRVRVRV